MSRLTLACAAACALVAALAVAEQRLGLALTVALLLVLATAATASTTPRTASRSESSAHDAEDSDLGTTNRFPKALGPVVLGVALAVQPTLRDAGPVVAVSVAGVLLAAAWAAAPLAGWRALGRAVVAPLRLEAGALLLGRVAAPAARRLPNAAFAPIARGAALALAAGGTFALLLGSADEAFAQLAGNALEQRPDVGSLVWRMTLGAGAAAIAGALAFAALRRPATEAPGAVPARVEVISTLIAVVAVFAAFVAVQLRVLFGGPAYVQATTGLGYGDYARSGFVALLAAAALTLVVIAIAARRRDRLTRGLLGALCLLTLVVLASAAHRLGLVLDAYGPTRVRAAGVATIAGLALVLLVVLAAGTHRRLARLAPPALAAVTLATALGFCVANPDRRIATAALKRTTPDLAYLSTLSADALPQLRRLTDPSAARTVERRLRRPDGVAGFNLARNLAR